MVLRNKINGVISLYKWLMSMYVGAQINQIQIQIQIQSSIMEWQWNRNIMWLGAHDH